ncbi:MULTISPECIES: phage antirepressor N-terminal domain-containing protein [unclassified Acinetobacter]|uniref:phage antirepressor N-terminal domain-containing protein n=1 Tax=unclassified Acinetobacter TaxID=196816 RepID=UPI0015D1A2AF|nr:MULTISPECIES: phage antirepressor N-terminal domain-containing protein [unclassified Acinetobacter]
MNSLTQMTVPFHNTELYLVEHNGQPYVPMRPVVEGMGLTWASQTVKFNSNKARWGVSIIETPTLSGIQEMLCIPLRKLFGWFTSISPNKVKPELRETVITYQNECDDVLWGYWTKGQAINQRKAISPEQQALLHEIVARRSQGERRIFAEMWARHNRHFKIPRYAELLAIHFPEAVHYLETMELKAKVSTKQDNLIQIDKNYHNNVQGLAWHMLWIREWWRQFGEAIRTISPHMAGAVHDHFQDGAMFAFHFIDKDELKKQRDRMDYYQWHLSCTERMALDYKRK